MWLEFDEQSTGGRGLSDVGGRTNRRVKVITWGGSSYDCCYKQKDIMVDSISVQYRIYMDKLTVQQTATQCELMRYLQKQN